MCAASSHLLNNLIFIDIGTLGFEDTITFDKDTDSPRCELATAGNESFRVEPVRHLGQREVLIDYSAQHGSRALVVRILPGLALVRRPAARHGIVQVVGQVFRFPKLRPARLLGFEGLLGPGGDELCLIFGDTANNMKHELVGLGEITEADFHVRLQ